MKKYIVPYIINGVRLWAVEDDSGYVFKYCSSKTDAESYIENN